PTTTALLFKSATINHSLHSSAVSTGMTHNMLTQLETMFKNVNFSHGIHRGDQFAFLYKEYYVNGKKYRPGDVVAATFTHEGHTYRVVRFQYPHNHASYFTADGYGLEPRFLVSPLHYRHISSYFNMHRFDPILHKVRPHLGIDYAANNGTPIKSIGD